VNSSVGFIARVAALGSAGAGIAADALALAGDDDGAATWCRIMTAVTELANKNPSPLRPPTSPVRT